MNSNLFEKWSKNEDVCPFCGSESIYDTATDEIGEFIYIEWYKCEECNRRWLVRFGLPVKSTMLKVEEVI